MEGVLENNYVISIDTGGTKTLAGVINSKEGIIARIKRPAELGGSSKEYLNSITGIVNDLIEKTGLKKKNIKAICIGIPGALNPHTGIVSFAPNLGLKNVNIKEKLQKKLSIPVLIENDVNLGALGSFKFGGAKKSKNMLAIFIGTGIGGGIIIDGKIYRGSNYSAGEIGHMTVDKKGPLCNCGNKGCFEVFASRTAIAKNIMADLKAKKKSMIKKLISPNKPIKSRMLAAAVKSNDRIVIKHISDACNTIGLVLANAANFMNFDMIVLGGGLIEALDYFMLPKIKESFKKYSLKDASKNIKIIANDLGDDVALYGGIALAEEFLNIKI
ncbi:MAG: ROK family protein [Ignavibacteriaceae bacterium]|nr:ROK family protein [Ignavibacteriaceae bacterium]